MPTQSDRAEVVARRQRWAWAAPAGVFVISAALTPLLDDLAMSVAAVAAVEFYVGVLAGLAWQLLYPRDFFERFRVWAGLLAIAGLLGFLPGAQLDTASVWAPPWAPLGVVVGVIVADAWARRRADGV